MMNDLICEKDTIWTPAVVAVQCLPAEEAEARIHDYMTHVLDELLESEREQPEWEVYHHLDGKLYTRTCVAPAGILLYGMLHKKPSLTVAAQGEADVLTINGCMRIAAPTMFHSGAGIRRLVYTKTEFTWTQTFAVESETIEDIEEELFTMEDML